MWFPSGLSPGEVRNGHFLLKVYRLLGSRWKGRESEISWDEDALWPQNQEPSSLPAVPQTLLTDVQPLSRFSTRVYKKLLIFYLKFTYSWALFHLAPYRRPPAGGAFFAEGHLREATSLFAGIILERWPSVLLFLPTPTLTLAWKGLKAAAGREGGSASSSPSAGLSRAPPLLGALGWS